jgi:glyoxylase-like metal-dependent hydrolase (beta-lactamase superfamily II)
MFLALLMSLGLAVVAADARLHRAAAQPQGLGTLRQVIPGYYVYLADPRISGVIATSEGVAVFDALTTDAIARHERQLISEIIGQPVRYLISSSNHGQYSGGNGVYRDVIRIGSEDYRTDLLGGNAAPTAEQQTRLPDLTFRDRMSFFLGGKEFQIIHVGTGHTRGDSILFVPQDRIVYTSEVFFYERFPFMDSGSLHWIDAIDTILNLDADIIVPGNGQWLVNSPEETRRSLVRSKEVIIAARDAVQAEISKGATEDEVAARVLLDQYKGMVGYDGVGGGTLPQHEVMVRRIYRELKGTRPQ